MEEETTPALTYEEVNQIVRKLAVIEHETNLLKAQHAARLAELQNDKDNLLYHYLHGLETWALAEANERGRKSVTLPYGTLAFRYCPQRVRVLTDSEEATQNALRQGYIKPVTPDFSAYRKAAETTLKETGELLPGVEIVEAYHSFSVRFKEDKTDEEEIQ